MRDDVSVSEGSDEPASRSCRCDSGGESSEEAMHRSDDCELGAFRAYIRPPSCHRTLSLFTSPERCQPFSEYAPSLDSERIEKAWRAEVIQENIVYGAKCILVELIIFFVVTAFVRMPSQKPIDIYVYDHYAMSLVIRIIVEYPLVIACLWRPRYNFYLVILVIDGLGSVAGHILAFMLPRPCKQNFEENRYFLLHAMMFYILICPVRIPEYRLMHVFLWCYVGVFFFFSAVAIRSDSEEGRYHGSMDLLVGALCLAVVNGIAIQQKWYLEKGQRKRLVMSLTQREVSKKMFHVLEYMVPSFVIMPMLKRPGEPIAHHVGRASVLFITFVEFNQIACRLPPTEVLAFLNRFFTQFDEICAARGVTKIETVGEEYVCAVGVVPADRIEDATHGHQVVLGRLLLMALDILELQSQSDGVVVFQMGVHTGPVVAGVVGQKLPRFRLFGDTMNTAARMMQKGLPGELQFGEETYRELPIWAVTAPRGRIEMKGKGHLTTYLLRPTAERGTSVVPASAPTESGATTPWRGRSRASTASGGVLQELLDSIGRAGEQSKRAFTCSSKFDEAVQEIGGSGDSDAPMPKKWWNFFTIAYLTSRVDFTQQEEKDFQRWYNEEHTFKKLGKRLDRQLCAVVTLTGVELMYLLFNMDSFRTVPDFTAAMSHLRVFLGCRATCFIILFAWRCVANSDLISNAAKCSQRCLLASHCAFAVLVFASYDSVQATFKIDDRLTGSAGSQFPMPGVSRDVLPLLSFATCTVVISAHGFLFVHSCVFAVAVCALGFVVQNTVYVFYVAAPDVQRFLVYSVLLNAWRSCLGECNLRVRFKAKLTVSFTLQRVEDILATLMPPMVLRDFCRDWAVTGPPSHSYRSATISQTDLCGFTALASELQPAEVVVIIGELFGLFDKLAELHEIYKVETVGDAYIAGSAEAPLTSRNSPRHVVLFALDVVQAVQQWSKRKGEAVSCRVGVHTGECVGGIVGTHMQRYHLFGQMMNCLEVIESTAPKGRVQLSQACVQALRRQAELPEGLCGLALVGISLEERTEQVLTTSKGEAHDLKEVGGPTFLASLVRPRTPTVRFE